jgi:hypothetical protein
MLARLTDPSRLQGHGWSVELPLAFEIGQKTVAVPGANREAWA